MRLASRCWTRQTRLPCSGRAQLPCCSASAPRTPRCSLWPSWQVAAHASSGCSLSLYIQLLATSANKACGHEPSGLILLPGSSSSLLQKHSLLLLASSRIKGEHP